MTIDREVVLHLAAQRAGFTESQLDALRRRDYTALLTEWTTEAVQPEPTLAADVLDATAAMDSSSDLERASRNLAALRSQRDAALQMLRQLAKKLGCCPHCWGTVAACATCTGRGSPGHFPPDPHLREWLAPALARGPNIESSDLSAPPFVPMPSTPS